MSQAKVDRYKANKANRKKIAKKNKAKKFFTGVICALVLAAGLGWVGHSAYLTYNDHKEKESISVDYTPLNDFLTAYSEQEAAD